MLDIKLKNNNKTRITITVALLLVLSMVTVCFIPSITKKAEASIAEWKSTESEVEEVNMELLRNLYAGAYVLYLEMQQANELSAKDVYVESSYSGDNEEKLFMLGELEENVENIMENVSSDFEMYREQIDYAILLEDGTFEKNTDRALFELLNGNLSASEKENLQKYYSDYFIIRFDDKGMMSVLPQYSKNIEANLLIKKMGQTERQDNVWNSLEKEYEEAGLPCKLNKPVSCSIVYAIPRTSDYQIVENNNVSTDYWMEIDAYADQGGAAFLYEIMLVTILLLMFIMTSKTIWKDSISMQRPGKWYLGELAVTGVFVSCMMLNTFVEIIWDRSMNSSVYNYLFREASVEHWSEILVLCFYIFCIYGIWYLSIRFLRPVFTLGVREYIRQYSFVYQIFPWLKKKWNAFMDEVRHIDFSEKSTKTIVKIVLLNFVILACCSFMWFFGILALLVYSVILFLIIKKYYDKAGQDYQKLLHGVNRIAEGDLDAQMVEDLGVFEPFKGELAKIQNGLKKAVDEEVKSQRMKTELITNVSHDLKTPLTAIMTYIELLKKEEITEEERKAYIETLDKKALRLKILIEDLFEVSKASSNNIVLNPIELDVTNLMKQVSIEHAEKYEEMGLELRWNVPEEKVCLMLDNQKTYRIFENLFGNVQKYAMPNSRVYVDIMQSESGVDITVKNMSAQELNFNADEIVERFVRGDSSRNTEGSGLGLAIAKSFTEVQGGKLSIEIDGDLFKAILHWNR